MKKRGMAFVLCLAMAVQMLTGCSLGKAPAMSVDSSTLQIGIVAKGYGDEFVKQLASAFEQKTSDSWVSGQMQAGAKNNDIDIIFDINSKTMRNVAVSDYVDGYERAYADLSDIFDEVPEGYDTDETLEEMLNPYALKACTWGEKDGEYGDGKQYFLTYATGLEGLVYNADLFEKYKLSIPKTTTQFFALMDQMKTLDGGSYAKNKEGREVYPYVFSGKVNYSEYLGVVWWAQFDGLNTFYNVLEGKDAAGNYSANSLKSPGKLSAMTLVSQILNQKNGYTSEDCYTQSFTDAQVKFLDNQAFMMSTGEWIEREMSSNFEGNSLNIRFMPIPVNSDIVMQCDSVKTEEKLVEALAYIDGETDRPKYLSDADEERLKEARSMYCSEGNQHIAYIPVYSNMVEEAKDFFRFMMSKEGQEIMLQYSYGNMAPLDVDVTKFSQYENISNFQKAKYEMQSSKAGLNLVGNNYYHPMGYAGSVQLFYSQPTMENAFGVIETSDTYMTADEIWMQDYERMAAQWANEMTRAGVTN